MISQSQRHRVGVLSPYPAEVIFHNFPKGDYGTYPPSEIYNLPQMRESYIDNLVEKVVKEFLKFSLSFGAYKNIPAFTKGFMSF